MHEPRISCKGTISTPQWKFSIEDIDDCLVRFFQFASDRIDYVTERGALQVSSTHESNSSLEY